MFRRMFGKKTESTVSKSSTVPQVIIMKLRECLVAVETREEFLHKRKQSVMKTSKKRTAMGDKKGTISILELKNTIESEIYTINETKIILETLVISLEGATQDADTFMALVQGCNRMKQIRTEIGIERLNYIMDNIKEQTELAQEINEALCLPLREGSESSSPDLD